MHSACTALIQAPHSPDLCREAKTTGERGSLWDGCSDLKAAHVRRRWTPATNNTVEALDSLSKNRENCLEQP